MKNTSKFDKNKWRNQLISSINTWGWEMTLSWSSIYHSRRNLPVLNAHIIFARVLSWREIDCTNVLSLGNSYRGGVHARSIERMRSCIMWLFTVQDFQNTNTSELCIFIRNLRKERSETTRGETQPTSTKFATRGKPWWKYHRHRHVFTLQFSFRTYHRRVFTQWFRFYCH